MTPEARLDRLERIAMLLARAGYRARRELRARDLELDKKLNHLIDLQIHNEQIQRQTELRFAQNEERFARNEERFAQNEERFARTDERFARTDERFAQNEIRFAKLAESQASADRRLESLMDLMAKGRNGN